jgi:hypothetical protein
VDLNLDTLKREILDYLNSAGFAVFHSSPGALDGLPMVIWDAERHPDYRMFLDAARSAGSKLICFGTRDFDSETLDDLLVQLEDSGFGREEERDYETRLREMRVHEGVTCSIEMAFDYDSRLYVYEVRPDWYEEFLTIEDEIMSQFTAGEQIDDTDTLGGYFSKN